MAKQQVKTSATSVADVTPEQLQSKVLELEGLLAAEKTAKEELGKAYNELQNEFVEVSGAKASLETNVIALGAELEAVLESRKLAEEALEKLMSASVPTETNEIDVEAEEIEEARPEHTLTDGRKFSFTKKAPKHLKVLGVVHSQAELVKNKEAMEFLIYGNSFFVEQINSK
ncbi:MAG: hypothetical protein WC389_00120 [Lutibacter sp.]|jgi:chromosome segregation ATPase